MKSPQAFLMVLALLSAGCTQVSQPPSGLEASSLVYDFEAFTWPPPIVYDANGTILPDHPLALEGPRLVEQFVPGVGAEPTVGVRKDGSLYVLVTDHLRRSTDQGRTWTTAHEFKSPNAPQTRDGWRTTDPLLWVDPVTDRAFVSHMHPAEACTFLAFSDQPQRPEAWTERPAACGTPLLDHQKVATAPYRPDGPQAPPLTYSRVLYQCVNKFTRVPFVAETSLGAWCATSFDSGLTFAYDREVVPPDPSCLTIAAGPMGFPDGTIAVPVGAGLLKGCHRPVTVMVSRDHGLTWDARRLPGAMHQAEIDPDMTITPDGTAYLVFRSQDQHVYLARSRDQFKTWDGPWRVSPSDHTLGVFTAITSGENGRISMTYLGTRDPQDVDAEPSTAVGGTRWHLLVTTSLDADAPTPTFHTTQVTPEEDPAQIGCIWLYGGWGGPKYCRNLLDFLDVTLGPDGRVYASFTDGCSDRNGCMTDAGSVNYQSRDMRVAVAVQDSGLGLRGDGPLPALGLVHPAPAHPLGGR